MSEVYSVFQLQKLKLPTFFFDARLASSISDINSKQKTAIENLNKQPDSSFRREDVIFDPTRPMQTDWETVLAKVAEKLIAAKKQKT